MSVADTPKRESPKVLWSSASSRNTPSAEVATTKLSFLDQEVLGIMLEYCLEALLACLLARRLALAEVGGLRASGSA